MSEPEPDVGSRPEIEVEGMGGLDEMGVEITTASPSGYLAELFIRVEKARRRDSPTFRYLPRDCFEATRFVIEKPSTTRRGGTGLIVKAWR